MLSHRGDADDVGRLPVRVLVRYAYFLALKYRRSGAGWPVLVGIR